MSDAPQREEARFPVSAVTLAARLKIPLFAGRKIPTPETPGQRRKRVTTLPPFPSY